MDPDAVTIVVGAVAGGAAAGLKDTATQAVKDSYAGLRKLITSRYGCDPTAVEDRPQSLAKRDSLAEDLREAGAADDGDLIALAREVLAIVVDHAPAAGPAIGIDIEGLRAQAVRIQNVTAKDTGVKGRDWVVSGDVDISGVNAGSAGQQAHP